MGDAGQRNLLQHDDASRGRRGSRAAPVQMLPHEIVRIETAMLIGQVGDKTIRVWAKRDGIGRQSDKCAPLQISAPALCMRVDNQMEAIERLRNGDRDHPLVQFYIRRAEALLSFVGGRNGRKAVRN